jgi:hypothetical protein
MFPLHQYEPPEKMDFLRASAALLLLVGLFALLALLPKRDPTKVVSELPCSVVTETQVGDVFGTRMRLMPTEGTICHYVAANTSQQDDLFVIALTEGGASAAPRTDAQPAPVFVRRGARTYEFVAVPNGLDAISAMSREHRLASLVTRRELAQQ